MNAKRLLISLGILVSIQWCSKWLSFWVILKVWPVFMRRIIRVIRISFNMERL